MVQLLQHKTIQLHGCWGAVFCNQDVECIYDQTKHKMPIGVITVISQVNDYFYHMVNKTYISTLIQCICDIGCEHNLNEFQCFPIWSHQKKLTSVSKKINPLKMERSSVSIYWVLGHIHVYYLKKSLCVYIFEIDFGTSLMHAILWTVSF